MTSRALFIDRKIIYAKHTASIIVNYARKILFCYKKQNGVNMESFRKCYLNIVLRAHEKTKFEVLFFHLLYEIFFFWAVKGEGGGGLKP